MQRFRQFCNFEEHEMTSEDNLTPWVKKTTLLLWIYSTSFSIMDFSAFLDDAFPRSLSTFSPPGASPHSRRPFLRLVTINSAWVSYFKSNHVICSAQRRYDNLRVRESDIQQRLCFDCGRIVNGDDFAFQQHMIAHEAAFICYQVCSYSGKAISE